MRASQQTALPSLRILGALSAVLAVGALGVLSACADALHLDPPGTGGSSTKTTASTSSSSGGSACHSNPDCAYPAPVCDTVSTRCVECLVLSDCAGKTGTVCSMGTCVCPNPDGSAGTLTYCVGETPACVDTTTSLTNCGQCGMPCAGTCNAGVCNTGTGTGTGGAGGAGTGGSVADDGGDDSG